MMLGALVIHPGKQSLEKGRGREAREDNGTDGPLLLIHLDADDDPGSAFEVTLFFLRMKAQGEVIPSLGALLCPALCMTGRVVFILFDRDDSSISMQPGIHIGRISSSFTRLGGCHINVKVFLTVFGCIKSLVYHSSCSV